MEAERTLPREYRVKPGRMTGVYIAVGVAVPAGILPLLNDRSIPGGVKALIGGLLLAFVVWIVVAARNCSTTADRTGLRVRGMVRTRGLAWSEVHDIRAAPNPSTGGGQPRVLSYAYGRDGRRVQLMYLDDTHVVVEQEIAVLRAAWEELRGADWTPDAAAERLIGRRRAREGSLFKAMYWAFGSVFVALALFVVLLVADGAAMAPEWILVAPVVTFFVVWAVAAVRARRR
ncbi:MULTISPECIES: PH domain-containing protein [unclassified Streptomyces]|uniref:PH domain-containing protein n=1 Tax=unclassified Streptomyces TaxID=2593676 RepID=UPI003450D2A5